jgi:hypothetical protein
MTTPPAEPPNAAILAGILVRSHSKTEESLAVRVRTLLAKKRPRFDVGRVVAVRVGAERFAVGVARAAVSRVFDEPAQWVAGLTLARRWRFDQAPSGPFVEEDPSSDPSALLDLLPVDGITVEPLSTLEGPRFDPESDEVDGILAGPCALMFGCLLNGDGDNYKSGRVQTVRSSYDDDVVRIVGVEVARASAERAVRLGAAVDWQWADDARAEISAVIDKPVGYWLVQTES